MEHALSVAAAPAAVRRALSAAAGRRARSAGRRRPDRRFNGVKRVPVQGGKWRAEIIVQGHKMPLGNFDVEEDAARAYDAARSQWQTLMVYVKCPLNFPGEAPPRGRWPRCRRRPRRRRRRRRCRRAADLRRRPRRRPRSRRARARGAAATDAGRAHSCRHGRRGLATCVGRRVRGEGRICATVPRHC